MELQLTSFFLVFARAAGLFTLFPIFSGRYVPMQIKVALCAILSFITVSFNPINPPVTDGFIETIIYLIREFGAGLFLGLVCRLCFFAFELAGHIISQEIGLNNASLIAPFSDSRTDMASMILFLFGGVIFLCFDLHHWVIAGFQRSFIVLPLCTANYGEEVVLSLIKKTSMIFTIALLISAPIMVISFLVTIVFAILSRAIPQMNVFLESLVVRPLIGLAAFGLTLNLMAQHVLNYLRRLPEDMLQLARLLGMG